MNRGDRSELIFRDDADRNRFLENLGEACTQTEWRVHALCLMGNHLHLVPGMGAIRWGWLFGAPELKEELLARASERVRPQLLGTGNKVSGPWCRLGNQLGCRGIGKSIGIKNTVASCFSSWLWAASGRVRSGASFNPRWDRHELWVGAIASRNTRSGSRSNGLPRRCTHRRVPMECLAKRTQENVSASIFCSRH